MTATVAPPVAGPASAERVVGPARLAPAEAFTMLAALVAGFVVRWQVISGPLGYVDLDEATAGIAAQGFFSNPSVFFPAQPYGGTPETVLAAVIHAVFGSGPVALKVTATLLHLAACGFVWGAARRIVPSRAGQLLAPILLWLGPAAGVWESTKERGFYGAAIVAAAALIWLAARIDERVTRRDVVAFGACVGLGWWISPLVAMVAVPATVWLLVRDPTRLDCGRFAAPAAVAAASPWLLWNLANGFASLSQPPSLGTDLVKRFGEGMSKLSVLIGIETPWDQSRALIGGSRAVAVIVVLVAVVVAFGRHPSTGSSLAGALVIGYLLMYPLANTTGTVGADPRYLYPMLPGLALLAACLVPVGTRAPGAAVAFFAGALALATSSWGLTGLTDVAPSDRRFLSAPGTTEVIELLEAKGPSFVTTDLAGAQITYATKGRIPASSFLVPRFPELERGTLVERPSTYVLDRHLGENAARLETWLTEHEVAFDRSDHGVWAVFSIDVWVPPWEAGLGTLQGVVQPPTS